MKKGLGVDFLNAEHDGSARRTTIRLAAAFTLLVGVLAAVGAGASYRSAALGTNVLFEIGNLPVISGIRRLVYGDEEATTTPNKTPDGRVNIMLFGIGGAGHEGGLLTDTILFVSADTQNDRVGMLSIPRDMAYPLGEGRFQKINAVHAYAEQDNPGEGATIAAKSIGKLLGARVDHVARIDFRGFEKFIDALGGVEIDVERSFVDPEYPTENNGWQTVSFEKGVQKMDGKRALIFVRSRHGTNGEGSDFARSRRQQLVIAAVRDKLFSLGVIGNPAKIAELWNVVSSHVQTDLSAWDLVKLAPLISNFGDSKVVMNVLAQDELVAANVNGAYMLFPRKPDWSDIRNLAQNPFETKEEREAKNRPAEEVRVEVKNGTTHTGFAGQVADALGKSGYVVTGVGNATRRGYERTVIFDLTGGARPTELARLKNLLNANVSAIPASTQTAGTSTQRVVYAEGLTAEPISGTSTEFLVILGESSLGFGDPYSN